MPSTRRAPTTRERPAGGAGAARGFGEPGDRVVAGAAHELVEQRSEPALERLEVVELGVARDERGERALVVEPQILAPPDEPEDGHVLEAARLAVDGELVEAARLELHVTVGQDAPGAPAARARSRPAPTAPGR